MCIRLVSNLLCLNFGPLLSQKFGRHTTTRSAAADESKLEQDVKGSSRDREAV